MYSKPGGAEVSYKKTHNACAEYNLSVMNLLLVGLLVAQCRSDYEDGRMAGQLTLTADDESLESI